MTFVKIKKWEPTILDYVKKKRDTGGIRWGVMLLCRCVMIKFMVIPYCLSLDMLNASKISMNEKLIAEISCLVSYVRGNDLMHWQGSYTYSSSFRCRNYQEFMKAMWNCHQPVLKIFILRDLNNKRVFNLIVFLENWIKMNMNKSQNDVLRSL